MHLIYYNYSNAGPECQAIILPKPFVFIHKTSETERHPKTREIRKFTTAQVDTNVKHGLFLFEQLAYLHTENTQTKLQTLRPMNTLWKIITCLLC